MAKLELVVGSPVVRPEVPLPVYLRLEDNGDRISLIAATTKSERYLLNFHNDGRITRAEYAGGVGFNIDGLGRVLI